MALKLVVNNVENYEDLTDTSTKTKDVNVTLMTDTTTSSLILMNVTKKKQKYVLSLMNLVFQKKMYQPTEILATIMFSPLETKDGQETWYSIKADVFSLFKDKKVELYDNVSNYKIGDDFYVQEVSPSFKPDSLIVRLKIYSLDKLLTLKHDCRSFVSMKLGAGILATEMEKYTKPYASTEKVAFNSDNMKVLSSLKELSVQKPSEKWAKADKPEYETKSVGTEHIFPYLVQYNESFYDMLVRTTNRWGEFMYYEDGQLNIGYPDSTKVFITHEDPKEDKYKCINYINLDDIELASNYDRAADYDKNILDATLEKSPNSVSGLLLAPGGKMDKVIMKKIAAFFKNDKNIPTFIGNQLFDDLYSLATKEISVDNDNKEFDAKHFSDDNKKEWPEKFGEYNFGSEKSPKNKDGFNMFTEVNSEYTSKKYGKILSKEKAAGLDAVCVDFDTYFPCLKLGQVIEVYSKDYIVVQIDCKPNYQYKVNRNNWVVANNDNPELVFSVIATPRDSEEVKVLKRTKDDDGKMQESEGKETPFYPTVIASGHARYADPQMATVIDADDPAGKGRVRVMFAWESIPKDNNDKIDFDQAKKQATPWLQFTANAGGGKGIMGKHYPEDKVFVGFLDGNVERPYVIGAVSKGADTDVTFESPGGHSMTIGDDAGGIQSFVLGTLTPGVETLTSFLPDLSSKFEFGKGWDKNLCFGGGFEITDKYGIYKISGSTDGREVAIASPWGDVNVSAFTGINISAPNGDISIKGKNISIEAGNNLSLVSGKNVSYKLWQEKDSKKADLMQFALDIPLAVAKKVAEKVTNLVDLSIVRSMVEIVMKPVEGALTVKSNRFLKLEAGKSECAYPVTAYKKSKEELQKELDEEKKKDILEGTGKILGVGRAMTELFESIKPVIQTLDDHYQTHYNKCVDLKKKLKTAIEDLEPWRNKLDDDTKYACGKKFDDLWTDLMPKLWVKKDKYEDLKEADLQFSDLIEVEGNPDAIVDKPCHDAHTFLVNLRHPIAFGGSLSKGSIEAIDAAIVEHRKVLRKNALDALNALGKEINYLLNFDMKRQYTTSLSSFYVTPVPKDYKDKMMKALSRENCPDLLYYKMPSDDQKKLTTKYNTDEFCSDLNVLYAKRIVAMNLIKEFGFYLEDLPANSEYAIDPAIADSNNKKSVLHPDCWKTYVGRISGVPALGRASSSISSIAKGALSDALDNLTFWDSTVEKFTWGNGADGKILFSGDDKKTYVLASKAGDAADVVEPTFKTLKASDYGDKEKERVQNFVKGIQKALENVK